MKIKSNEDILLEIGEDISSYDLSDFSDFAMQKDRPKTTVQYKEVCAYDKYGQEIYGIDFLIRYFSGNDVYVLIVSDPSGNYQKRYPKPIDGVVFINYPHSYFEVLKHADFFVRNTSTDGDALSVKEALYLKIPTLCTDVVDRPDGACLFKYSDAVSFTQCLQNAIAPDNQIVNGAVKILMLYKEIEN